MSATPPYLHPFVLPIEPVEPVREDAIDWYLPAAGGRAPAVVFIHGGPVPPDLQPPPTGWPVFQGYGAWAARAGLVGVTFDHGFTALSALDDAQADIERVVETVRGHARVDGDRVLLWGFSGGGMLLGRWIASPPGWLRGVAATYPCCRPLEEVPHQQVGMADAVASAGDLPLLLTRVGLEREALAQTVAELVDAAHETGARLDIVDVPNGHHGFDHRDDTEESHEAICAAMTWVERTVRG